MKKYNNPIKIPADHRLAQDPELATVWVLMQIAWDKTESHLLQMFSLLSGMDYFDTRIVVARIYSIELVTTIVRDFAKSPNLPMRLKKEIADSLFGLAGEIKKKNTIRNDLIHGEWATYNDKEKGISEIRRAAFRGDMLEAVIKRSLNYSKADIMQFIEELNDLNSRIIKIVGPALFKLHERNMAEMKKLNPDTK